MALAPASIVVGQQVRLHGAYASQIVRINANVADPETVTIGSTVYEFDIAANGVVAGRVAILSAGATPDLATTALAAAINTQTSATGIRALKMTANEVLVISTRPGVDTTALSETMGGALNVVGAATLTGGGTTVSRMAFTSRVPTTSEVGVGFMRFVFPFTPRLLLVHIHDTANGLQVLWNGTSVISTDGVCWIDNGGGTDWATGMTVNILAIG